MSTTTTTVDPPTSTTSLPGDPTTTTTAVPDGPTIVLSDASVAEPAKGSADMFFTVTLVGTTTGKVSVHYQTADGTATARLDYSPKSGNIKFKPGHTTATIRVKVRADKVSDPNEWFQLNFTKPVGAELARSYAIGTILGG